MESLAAVLTIVPEEEREDSEIIETTNSFVVEVSHITSVILREELENLLGLHVIPLVDAREGLEEVEDRKQHGVDTINDEPSVILLLKLFINNLKLYLRFVGYKWQYLGAVCFLIPSASLQL